MARAPAASPLLPGRRWDLLFAVGIVLLIAAGAHLELMLFTGDWSFWADWRDRQWWPLLVPAANIILPATVQYIAWSQLRLPLGATLTVVCLVVAAWLSRVFNFGVFAYLPVNFVAPETLVLLGLVLDLTLLATRSFVLTSVIGGFLWGVLFQPLNAPLVAPFWEPVLYQGHLLTVGDVMAFEYVRTQTPPYVRIVEQGHLRAFLQQLSYVVAFFAGMVSMGTYWVGQFIGRYLAVGPIDRFFPRPDRREAGPAGPGPGDRPRVEAAESGGA